MKSEIIKGIATLFDYFLHVSRIYPNLGDHKGVGDGVIELRLFFGPGYRLYCGRDGETIIVMLCGGDKSSQDKDIEKAKVYWDDYNTE